MIVFSVFSTNVSQEYLQSEKALNRDIFANLCEEFKLERDKIITLLKPLYSISKSGDYWGRTFQKRLLN